jgi:hypothetical protein
MTTTSQLIDILRNALADPQRGVVGAVEDLLEASRQHPLRIEWQGDHCRVYTANGDSEVAIDVAFPKSVFRAILARVAKLCNERNPNSVSPYGGQGVLISGANPPTEVSVTILNTASEQELALTAETRPTVES